MPQRPDKLLAVVGVVAIFTVVLVIRVVAPSDINGTDQMRTMSYTLDMAIRGGERLILPVDSWSFPATKPPLYNWIGLPFLEWLGPSTFVYKLPAILTGLLATGVVAIAGWQMAKPEDRLGVSILAATAFLTGETIAERLYYARPDMPLIAMTAGAFLVATTMLRRVADGDRPSIGWAAAFWLFVTLGLLAKGPPALIPVGFAVVAAKVCLGSWRHVNVLRWWIGLPVSVAIFGGWLGWAASIDGDHAGSVLVGEEVSRVSEGAARIAKDVYRMPKYFVEKFLPWSLLFFLGLPLVRRGSKRWDGPTGPAVLYVLIWLVVLTLPASKRSVYLGPAYVAAAPVAAMGTFWLLKRFRLPQPLAVVPAVAGFALCWWHFMIASLPATTLRGERLETFARQIELVAGDDEILFVDAGNNPLQSLLSRHMAADKPSMPQWVVTRHVDEFADEPIVSEEIWDGVGGNEVKGNTMRLILLPIDKWTGRDSNPRHSG